MYQIWRPADNEEEERENLDSLNIKQSKTTKYSSCRVTTHSYATEQTSLLCVVHNLHGPYVGPLMPPCLPNFWGEY